MQGELLKKISEITSEERNILSGVAIDKKLYTAGEDFIINDKRLTKGSGDIMMRTHPRYLPFPPHRHTFAEMMMVFSGEITHVIAEKRITLRTGDILILNKHVSHSIEVTDTPDVGMNVIISDKFADLLAPRLGGTIFSQFFAENAKADGAPGYLVFRTLGSLETENLTENLVHEFTLQTPDELIIKDTLSLLFYHLSKNRESQLTHSANLTGDTARKLEISAYVKSNYRTASLTDLADRLYVSAPYLSKTVKRYFGKSFKELLLAERVARATELFRESELPIGAVIRSMGYENESYFHREYKRRTGKTPLAVRKEAKSAKIQSKKGDLT